MKKRREFVAVSYEATVNKDERSLRFFGEDHESTLVLTGSPSGVSARFSDEVVQLNVLRAGLLGRSGWFRMGLTRESHWHGVSVFVGTLDHDELDRAIQKLVDGTPVMFHHFQRREWIVIAEDGSCDDGDLFQAIVWDSGPECAGRRFDIRAESYAEARAEIRRRFGKDAIFFVRHNQSGETPR